MNKIYLDNAATTATAPEVIDLLCESLKQDYGNPSSIHTIGRQARAKLNAAREFVAEFINASSAAEVVFLSSATEANNTVFNICNFDLIITSPSEHSSVIEAAKQSRKLIKWLNLDSEGFISLDELEETIKANPERKILVSIMHGNSEIGTIQDLQAIGEICSKYENVAFHSDCVQTLTKVPIDVQDMKLDFICASAHKIHGPKGVGMLYINKAKKQLLTKNSLIFGGGQENYHRAGTENTNGVTAFIEAMKLNADQAEREKVKAMWLDLYQALSKLPGFVLNGAQDFSKRVPGNLNVAFKGSKFLSEQMVLQLDLKGICASSGSACTTQKRFQEASIESSYVLRACGIAEDIATRAVRLSVSRFNSTDEIKQAAEIFATIV
jgi:cysteine desulfurase